MTDKLTLIDTIVLSQVSVTATSAVSVPAFSTSRTVSSHATPQDVPTGYVQVSETVHDRAGGEAPASNAKAAAKIVSLDMANSLFCL